ncbi:MAG: 2,3-bisphosphoglycerate-independent phosphoglycerate mutase [Candidatus Moranbacteria bacterium]|nr:2,3-bisphosphoglycerate-independent phosphoglycerate mutase [Candidatus Moranbacteria bacterium]
MNKKQVALIVLDGWGYRENAKDNAIAEARKPVFDSIWTKWPHTLLDASGLAVGLPVGQMGNSEVGHTTIGVGKAVDQDLVRIDKAIANGDYSKNEEFQKLFEHVKSNNSTLHVMGLLSDGGIHSHINHLFAFIDVAKMVGIQKLAVHVFTDGRDTPPQSGASYIKKLEDKLKEIGLGTIASVSGRYYAMDRDKNWDRFEKTEEVIFEGKGEVCDIEPSVYLDNLYKSGSVDELLIPFVCLDKNGERHTISKNDGIFFFNYRADRARMMTSKILEKEKMENLLFVTMTEYGQDYKTNVAFPPVEVGKTLACVISENGLTQAHVAETEKFAHATYFLNGGIEKVYDGEEDILVPSRKDIKTYDEAPKMSAEKIADEAISRIEKGVDFIFINFANPDMVGHTAVVPAIIEAIEETDKQLGRVLDALQANNGIAIVTADHGNAEINIDPITGLRHTAHTTDPVPCILVGMNETLHEGTLADLAPTIFKIYGIGKPEEMKGEALF